MAAKNNKLKKLFSQMSLAVGALVCFSTLPALANGANTVNLDSKFAQGHTATVAEISDFPESRDNAVLNIQYFKRSALSGIYADSRQSINKNKPIFTVFDQDPRAPNQQRLTYLNVQSALDTMLYGDDPKRKAVHLASLKKGGIDTNQVNGYGTNVAVIDSGINTRQPDFSQSVKVHDLGGQKYANEVTHGTEVALTAAGKGNKYQGVAPGARVHAYAIDPNDVALEDVFVTVYKDKVSVANASFVLGDDTSIFPSIRNTFYKIFKNQDAPLYVFAAGNKDEPSSHFSPLLKKLIEDTKIMSNTLVVSGVKIRNPNARVDMRNIAYDPDAISCKDVKYNCLTAFFAYDVPDPRATSKGNNFVTSYGTSFSAPQVSGGAALVKQMFPWFNADNIRQTLLTTATDIGAPGIDDTTGWGLLNVGNAVRGPAQFAFGDFIADLTHDKVSSNREVFYFRNNIFGRYGLVVQDNSGSSRTLILSGNNTYSGKTTIKSGIVRLEGSLKSQTNIDHDGLFQLSETAESGSVYNNGFLVTFGGTIKGEYTSSSNAIATVTLTKPLIVDGTAKLNGSLVVDIPSSFRPLKNTAYLILKADKLESEFKALQVSGTNYRANLYYDYSRGQVAIKFE